MKRYLAKKIAIRAVEQDVTGSTVNSAYFASSEGLGPRSRATGLVSSSP
jgi:hypothetical protein